MTDRAGVDPTAALRDLLERIEAGQPLDAALFIRIAVRGQSHQCLNHQ